MILPYWVIVLMIIGGIISSIGSLFLKKGSEKVVFSLRILFNKNLIIGFSLYGIASILGIIIYKGGELSVTYPIGTSLSYILVTLLSVYILKEKMNIYKYLGILSIIIGVILIVI